MGYYTDAHYRTANPYNSTYTCDSVQVVTRQNAKGMFIVRYDKNSSTGKYKYAVMSLTNPITYNAQQSAESNFDRWSQNNNMAWSQSSNNADGRKPSFPTNASTQPIINGWQGLGVREWGFTQSTHCIFDVDFPVFNYNDEEGINKYVNDGDDSNATNYDELHPNTMKTTLYIDGEMFPNLWIVPTIDQMKENSHMRISVYAKHGNISSFEDTQTVNGIYDFNTTNMYSFGQYAVNDTYEVRIVAIPIYEGENKPQWKCEGTFKINKNDGTTSDHQVEMEDSTHHTMEFIVGTPDGSDYPNQQSEWDITPSNNTISGANTLTKTYQLSNSVLKTFGNFLWSNTFKDNIFGLCNYPLENVVSIKAMPLTLTGESANIKVGNVDTNIQATVINNADTIETTVGVKHIPVYYDNFMDYSEVDLTIYLPFIGFKPLDNIMCIGRDIRVKYYFDTILGNCLATIEVKDNKNHWLLIDCQQANCGVDIAISSTNRASIENGYINSALNVVKDIVNVNPIGIASDVFNGATQDFHTQSNGVGNPSVMSALDMNCYVIVKRPQPYNTESEGGGYGHFVGYPCHLYKKLKDLKITSTPTKVRGCFFKVKNFVASEIPNATEEEKAKLKELLESGVILYDR